MKHALRQSLAAALIAGALAGCANGVGPMEMLSRVTPGQTDELPAPASVKTPREVRVPTIAALPSKSAAYLVAHFGEPDIKRSETGAQFWTYSHANCVLYFILYDEGNGDYSLHHMEVDRQIADEPTFEGQLQACVKDVAVAFQTKSPEPTS